MYGTVAFVKHFVVPYALSSWQEIEVVPRHRGHNDLVANYANVKVRPNSKLIQSLLTHKRELSWENDLNDKIMSTVCSPAAMCPEPLWQIQKSMREIINLGATNWPDSIVDTYATIRLDSVTVQKREAPLLYCLAEFKVVSEWFHKEIFKRWYDLDHRTICDSTVRTPVLCMNMLGWWSISDLNGSVYWHPGHHWRWGVILFGNCVPFISMPFSLLYVICRHMCD